ncbi:hypothetical protein INS49_012825 [Diaporthe citri]|uniref:uncharacterized protein n=1 Tax=Diaporthe citri TaxID=83186 RepID=UPI001C7F42E6|nr:uncharacterized protein INS49_012825 [Diaporthe citri]KAG6359304.1 hypothetical protein INS49_012825 [Diaporthe citri]
MAPKNAQKRELSAAELAMLDDIGAGRIDELPLEDTGRVPRNVAAMNSIESGRTGTDNRWNQAIAGGAFEDDDAAVVAGQRELANGQLARMRRAADLSYMAVNRGFDYNDRRLRQNHNGQVAPRAQFFRGERGPARAGLAHTGDGPVELRGAMRNSRHAPQPAPVSNASTQRPARSSTNDMLPSVVSSAHGSDQALPFRARPLDATRPPPQPAAVPTVSSAPQEEAQVPSTTVCLLLPEGHSVLFQATVSFASPAFLDRIAEYPGTIYLVAGPATNEDQIILHIDEDRVGDVKRRTEEYVDYLSDADRLILQFKDEVGYITWFVVIFRQRDIMVAFVDALRKFVGRLKEPSPSPAAPNMGPSLVDTSALPVEPPHDISAPIIESPVLPNETAYDLTTAGKSLAETTSRSTVARQPDTLRTISMVILEDIVSWAMHIVAFVRDSGPAELANADALPGIIRGAAAAVLMEKHAGFADLDSKERVAYVDNICAPQVFERFKRRMLEDAAKKGPTEAVSTTEPKTQKSPDVQETSPPKRPRPKYTIQKLLHLESTAVDPPEFLTELRYLPEMNPENRALIEQIIRQAHGLPGTSLPLQAPQVSGRATPRTTHMNCPRAGTKLDGHVSPARAQNVGGRNSDAGSVHAAPALPTHPPRVTVTAPVEMPHPEEPLISIHGEMNGLNSSRHNKNGVDLLGQSAGQFTGALSKNKSHLEDLMLIDRVEDFEVIRANDPEVAEIADRFARVHFDDGLPT